MINIKGFDPNLNIVIIQKKHFCKNIVVYHIRYIPIKNISDCESINSVNPHLVISEVDGNKYLTFASTDNNKKVLEKYTRLWDEIKYHIQTTIELHMLKIIVRSVVEDDGKYYPQVYLDECLYEV